MNAQNHGPAPSQNEQLSVLQYHGTTVAFEKINGKTMVNATQMAKPFGKTPKDWLRTQQAGELLQAMSVRLKCLTSDLQVVRQGGRNQGTWFQEDVALFFAQWLSPEFYIACNFKLKELLARETLTLPEKYGVAGTAHQGRVIYPYTPMLRALGAPARGSTSRRKRNHPQHFVMLFGRNFVTGHYADLLKGYYEYKNAQLKLAI